MWLVRYPKQCPFPQEYILFFIPRVEERLSRKNCPTKKRMRKKQSLSIDRYFRWWWSRCFPKMKRQLQSSWYLWQPTLRCACSFFWDFWMSSSKWAMANAMPRSGFGLGFSSGFFAHCLPSSDSPSNRICCCTMDLPSKILGRMILWSLEALAQTGFFAW